MTIDPLIVALSILVGLPAGFFSGIYLAQWACDQYAKQMFDSMLALRRQAKSQMDKFEVEAKGGQNGTVRKIKIAARSGG